MLTIEEIHALAKAHPEFELRKIIRAHNPMLNTRDMNTDICSFWYMMAQTRQAQPKPEPDTLSYRMEDFKIPLRDGFQVDARSYTPKCDMPSSGLPRTGRLSQRRIYHGRS
ncbi:hypothetical protein ACJZ2D_009275 [Fusarium nematophilum]